MNECINIKIPFSRKYKEVDIPKQNLLGVLESNLGEYETTLSQQEIIQRALDNPIGSKSLEQLVIGKKNMVVITSDHTRPVPSKVTMPILLRRIRKVNPNINIKILIATGFHRETTKDELIDKFGENIANNEEIIIHDSRDKESLKKVGILPSGGELWLNKVALETELLISEGFIESHFFAGFSGGRKSVLPGIASAESIMANHCSEFINSPYARTGILKNNPIHADMLYAAKVAKLQFILNVVIDSDKKVINAFAGDVEKAHEEGCRFVLGVSKVDKLEADIAITSNGGYPLDQNIYQSVKGMTAGEATCKKGGVIIMVAACNDGHGGKNFYDTISKAKEPKQVLDDVLKRNRCETQPDQWEIQILARLLSQYTVIMVTDMCEPEMIEKMHMKHSYTIQEALDKAFKFKGKDSKVVVIPDGVSVIVK